MGDVGFWCVQDAMERGWFMTEDSVLNSEPTCDLFAVYSTAKDIACAMAYIHSKDIIHGDLQGDALGLASSTQDPRGFIAKVTVPPLSLGLVLAPKPSPDHKAGLEQDLGIHEK